MRRLMLGLALLGTACGADDVLISAGTTTVPEPSTSTAPSTTEPAPTTSTAPEPVATTQAPVVEPPATTVPRPVRTTVTTAYEPPSPQSRTVDGEWAIPTYIVMCESGGNWNAYNPSSGAAGPYQLMPFHFGDDARNHSQAEQHAMAAKLWNGGRGRSHWAACL